MNKKLVVLFFFALQLSSALANWGLLGAFDPGNGNNQGRVTAMGQWQNKQNSIQLVFTTFDEVDQSWLWKQLVYIWNSGKVPILSWEPWFALASSPTNIASLIAGGQYDSYITSWGSNLKTFVAGADGVMNTADDRRAFIRFAHEFNGNWYPWSASSTSTPQDYINMWRHVQDLITSLGADRKHVQWIWSTICCEPNGVSPMEAYFVGNDYIDWIGIGGFNWGKSVSWSNWYLASDQFTAMTARMRTLTGGKKPLAITEVSTVSTGGDKNAWLQGMFSFAQSNGVRLISYFNMDKNEDGGVKDWAVFDAMNGDETYSYNGVSYRGWSGYRNGLSNNYWIGSNPSLSTIISDNMFLGIGTCNSNSDCLSGYSCSSGTCVVTGTQASASPTRSKSASSASPSNSKGAAASKSPMAAVASPSNSEVSSNTLFIYKTGVAKYTLALPFGSSGTNVNFAASGTTPEGTTMISVNTPNWGGFGLYNPDSPIDVSSYTTLYFYLSSSAQVKVEIQDSNGKNSPVYIAATNNSWQKFSIPLTQFSNSGVNLKSINAVIIITMETSGNFLCDNVFYM